ncbi:hypothetical protein Unana1_03926 [Umbelopsis nana]
MQTLVDGAGKLGLVNLNPTRAADPEILEISVFENQRWWAGSGFTGQLLRAERKPWTNITGAEPLIPKEEMPPPIGYRWSDKEWKLDESGPWMDSILGIAHGGTGRRWLGILGSQMGERAKTKRFPRTYD